jgi:hypothetical protein
VLKVARVAHVSGNASSLAPGGFYLGGEGIAGILLAATDDDFGTKIGVYAGNVFTNAFTGPGDDGYFIGEVEKGFFGLLGSHWFAVVLLSRCYGNNLRLCYKETILFLISMPLPQRLTDAKTGQPIVAAPTWNRAYAVVLGTLLLEIALFYILMIAFE